MRLTSYISILTIIFVNSYKIFSQQPVFEWDSRYTGSPGYEQYIMDVITDSTGNTYVAGYIQMPGQSASKNWLVLKVTYAGIIQWVNIYNGSANAEDMANSIKTDRFGSIYVTGYTTSGTSSVNLITVKYSKNGDTLWTREFDAAGYIDQGKDISVDNDGNVYVTGYAYFPGDNSDIATVKYYNPQTGAFHPKITWDKNREPDLAGYNIYKGYPNNCASPPNGYDYYAYVPAGTTSFTDIYTTLYPNGQGTKQCQYQERSYYYKVEAVDYSNKKSVKSEPAITFGWLDPCAPEGDNLVYLNTTPAFFNIFNYPNPFNPETDIKFVLPNDNFVTVKVYNAIGEEVAVLVNNEWKTTGRYSVKFDGSNLASGIYFYSIHAGNFTDTKKMVLVK